MTLAEAEEIIGQCIDCGEWTSLAECCCGRGIYFEGGTLSIDDIEEEDESDEQTS